MQSLKKLFLRVLIGAGFRRREPEMSVALLHPWEEDGRFLNIMRTVDGHTLLDTVRCYMLYQFGLQTEHLPGDIAEVGVYRGGTAMLLARVTENSGKEIHLFDTFSGMPPVDPEKDLHACGDFGDTSVNEVKKYLSEVGHVRFFPGFFPDTAVSLSDKTFSLVHVDADIYQSVKDCLEFFYPRLTPGGIMVCDDYGFPTCPGARLAVDGFFQSKAEVPCYLPTGQCFITKHG